MEQYVEAFGYAYNANDSLQDQYASVLAAIAASDNIPSSEQSAWKSLGEACMRTRSLLYCSNTPGDCTTTKQSVNAAAASNLASVSQVGGLAKTGIGATGTILGATGIASGVVLSGITLGAGIILTAILTIFENHAAAEAKQANALCALCPEASAAIQATDLAVLSGQATPSQGIANLKALAQSFRNSTAGLTKACNAFCGYAAILDAIAAESDYFYTTQLASAPVVAGAVIQAAASTPASISAGTLLTSIPTWTWVILAAAILFAYGEGESQKVAA